MELTAEQIEEQKAAVAAMKNSQANMRKALDRISDLERALESAAQAIEGCARYVPDCCYEYQGTKKIREIYLGKAADARSKL